MKIDRLIWGILFLFVGGVLLLDNFNIITFYWRNVWQFWPVILIIAGVNVLLGKKGSSVGPILSLSILIIALGYIFYKGQQEPMYRGWVSKRFHTEVDTDRASRREAKHLLFTEPFSAGIKNATLNLTAGGSSVNLKGTTDSLIAAEINQRIGNFSFQKMVTDSSSTIDLKMRDKKNSWSMNEGGNDIDLLLNVNPSWEMNFKMGAGEIDLDLTPFKVRKFNFDGGAAAVDVKLGNLLPTTEVHVKTGVADVKISIPQNSGCRINTKTGLSVKDFPGFEKIGDGLYETPNFRTATHKIFINLDGGLSNFEVNRF